MKIQLRDIEILEPESAFTSGVRARNGKEGKSWRQKRTRTAIRQRLKPVQVGPIDISSSGMRFYYIKIICDPPIPRN